MNPPWELVERIAQHFEDCRRTSPTSTMAVFVLPKWAKFNQLTKHWKLCQKFLTKRGHGFSLANH
jgi:hypothetical protein